MNETLYTQAGIIRFYDGTIISIEQQEYSPDGLTNWEGTFNPNDHLSTLDGVTPIEGHKYKRVKHSGDVNWQMPYKIVAETPEFRISPEGIFEWRFEGTETWNLLIDQKDLKGNEGVEGKQGIPGEGFHIDLYGFYQARPDCSANLASNCTSCNQSNISNTSAITYMSLGDGVLVLTSILIGAGSILVDGVTYTHFSNDLITWTILSSGIADFEARYLATDATGTVYTDMQTEDYYGTRGIVYVCAEGNWTIMQLPTPSYMVGEAIGSTNIGFLDNFVTSSVDNLTGTISLDTGLFEIIEQSITEFAFAQTTFGDGLEILTPLAKPQINSSDFIGFGLLNYTSLTDGLEDIQVNIAALILDGLSYQAGTSIDGEIYNQAFVNVNDLINNNSFLIGAANPVPDTFNDLYVNIGLGLITDGNAPAAIDVNVDNLSLIVDIASLRVKPYGTGNDGIMLQHLNPNIVNPNSGLTFDTLNGLSARIDNLTIGYSAGAPVGSLEVIDHGITGTKLNSDVIRALSGLEYTTNELAVLVDGSTIGFNGIGQLTVLSPVGNVVDTITVVDNTATGNTVEGAVKFGVTDTPSISANIIANSGTDTIDLQLTVIQGWLENEIDLRISSGVTTYWDLLGKNSGDPTTTIEQYITGLNHVELTTQYGVAQIIPGIGIVLDSGSNKWQLIVDSNGNLDTTPYP